MKTLYSITEPPAGFNPRALNNNGQVAGLVWVPGDMGHAALWSLATNTVVNVIAASGLVNPYERYYDVQALDDLGRIVGQLTITTPASWRAFRWEPYLPNTTTGVRQLLAEPPGSNSGRASSVNRHGAVVGRLHAFSGSSVMWRTPSVATPLFPPQSPPPAHPFSGYATAINDRGQVVGTTSGILGHLETAYLWQPDTLNGDVGVAHAITKAKGRAVDINRKGQIAGDFTLSLSPPVPFPFTRHPFRWDPTTPNGTVGKLHDLGTLPGYAVGDAFAINSHGVVVGECTSNTGSGAGPEDWYRPFRHDGNTMVDLNDFIFPAVGWRLDRAIDVNDGGSILGYGIHNGRETSFLLTPTKWRLLDVIFLVAVVGILSGVRDDSGGWIVRPGKPPQPVPPWTRTIWRGLSASAKRAVREIAFRDGHEWIRDDQARRTLHRSVPALLSPKLERYVPRAHRGS